ncbi:serine/threonine-protein kinase [Paraliomyxa miuraensis]|uniref:serine/threonine-protein kinase n=1 Tax=Paraliomyxa miuraensis TaxID=376150 RepID=UPI002251B372|nr:serine/threonine-protein kinase [Paraliomyxa miuraensis]MCX4245375.1 serine/threonine-protein kinase [Paraliomyxa miuraensis]
MASDRSTIQQVPPTPSGRSDEVLHAAFARHGLGDEDLPEPATGDEVGRYTVLGHLGEGGMGVVYKAYDPQLDRNVALKLLRRLIDENDSGSELRLLREAQMLAKLQHPNVVTIHDAGLTRYGMFIAMDLLYGCTLREWLGRRPRSVSEVLEVFRAAGEGLAAAHDAGFVHRDFKPSNVIVGDDGMVRVLDFGVAALTDARVGARDATAPSRHRVARPPGTVEPLSRTDPHLTDEGCVVGTPAYMAPEQVAGDKADHRSDQFTFCVCLHLALYGRSPVIGERFEERRWNHMRGRVLDERGMLTGRTAGRVPARVRRVLRRGLSVNPDERFPSMRDLLDELREPPRRWPLLVAGPMLVLAFSAGLLLDRDEKPCVEPPGFEDDWSESDRKEVRVAFDRSGHPQARELSDRVERQLDGYAAAWSEMYLESCRETFVTRQQSEALFVQRRLCLERRRNRMRSAVDALTNIEDRQQAIDRTLLPFRLPMIDDCKDFEAVSATLPLPEDSELRSTVATLRSSIDEVETLRMARDSKRGLELAHSVVQEARRTQFSPIIAEALASLGAMQAMGASAREARATLEASILEAAKAGDDVTAAESWTWLVFVLTMQKQLDEGKTLVFAAQAAVERADDDEVRGWLLNNLGMLHGEAGEFERSLDLFSEALEVKQGRLGEEHVDVGISWHDLGIAQLKQERVAEAENSLQRARSIFEATVGGAHPLTYHALGGLCQIEHFRGNHEAAIGLCSRVLAHYEVSPVSDIIMGRTSFVMARALHGAGRVEEAQALARRALQLSEDEDPDQVREIRRWLRLVEGAPNSDPGQGAGGR